MRCQAQPDLLRPVGERPYVPLLACKQCNIGHLYNTASDEAVAHSFINMMLKVSSEVKS
jgi:hypothetical protein